MNENSPICARLKPAWMEFLRLRPDTRAPSPELMNLPTIVTAVRSSTVPKCSFNTAGSIIMPTDTKKTAAKRSFTGRSRCSMRLPSRVSARIEPMTKAPSAGEKPTFVAIMTIMRQSAIDTTSIVSSESILPILRRKTGTA